MTFSQKLIQVTFQMADGTFGGGGNSLTVGGASNPLRISCHIEFVGGLENATAKAAIFGLPLATMNQLTTFGTQYGLTNKNGIQISAGDASGMSQVFSGNIFSAYVDGNAQPQVCFRVDARPGTWYNVKPQTPLSFKGPTKATDIAQKIAGMLDAQLVDNGVKTVLTNPYFSGDAITMIHRLAEHAGFSWLFHAGNLTITPPGGSNAGSGGYIIKPPELVNYPIFVSTSIVLKTLFNPNIKFNDNVQVQSSLTPANGTWNVAKIEYDIESLMPHGKWFSTFNCNTTTATPNGT